jgi:hypothetical protein
MTSRLRALSLSSSLALLLSGCDSLPIAPADITGLRSFDGGATVLVLTFPAVKVIADTGMEDRTVAHFDVSVFAGEVPPVTLEVPVSNMDAGDPAGDFEVYLFAGDGVVSADEWSSGRLLHTFEDLEGGFQVLALDVTDLVQTAVDRGLPFVSFSFRAIDDRFALGAGFSVPGETALVVRAPAS